MIQLHFERETDALYLRLDDSRILESEEVAPGVVLDFNEANEVVGIEILKFSKRTSREIGEGVQLQGLIPV
jgi:uncharacterized protein YuzE